MKVALVVYSQTGNTRSVAEKIRNRLISDGHVADYIAVEHESKKDKDNPMEKVTFKSIPDLSDYDMFVFGAYTEAFNLSRVMQQFLSLVEPSDKSAVCLTTQSFMKSWLGGNAAQKKMKKLLTDKGYSIIGSAHVNWKLEEGRDERIEKAVDTVCALIK